MSLSPKRANAIADRYPAVRRDRLSELQSACDELSRLYPEIRWEVEQRRLDVPESEAEFAITPWFEA